MVVKSTGSIATLSGAASSSGRPSPRTRAGPSSRATSAAVSGSSTGVPSTLKMRESWSWSDVPKSVGRRPSRRRQPHSTGRRASSICASPSATARGTSVTTSCGRGPNLARARPKSASLSCISLSEPLPVDQQVLRLEVAVEHPAVVAEGDAVESRYSAILTVAGMRRPTAGGRRGTSSGPARGTRRRASASSRGSRRAAARCSGCSSFRIEISRIAARCLRPPPRAGS